MNKIIFFNFLMWYNLYGLYSEGKVDVSKIAEKYHGGGHQGASGFSSKELIFKKIKGDKDECWWILWWTRSKFA